MNARELLEALPTRPEAKLRFRGTEPWICFGVRPRTDRDLGDRTVLELAALDSKVVPPLEFGESIVVDPKTRAIIRVRLGIRVFETARMGTVPGVEATIDMAPEQDLAPVELELVDGTGGAGVESHRR